MMAFAASSFHVGILDAGFYDAFREFLSALPSRNW
jgi:hypothetical protein